MARFREYDPDQQLLLPPSLRDWLPPVQHAGIDESRTRVHVGLHGAESAEDVRDDGVEVVGFGFRIVGYRSF